MTRKLLLSENKMKINNFFKKILPLLPVIFIIVFSVILFIYVDPQNLINFVGLENAYLMMFLTAFLGGLSTFNFIPYYSVVLLLVNAGLNPFYVGATSAVGVMCGDSFSYFMGYSGGEIIPTNLKNFLNKVSSVAISKPKMFILGSFLYGCISPFSNDFITISAGIAHIPYRKVMIPLALGNLVFNISFSFLAVYGYEYVKIFFS